MLDSALETWVNVEGGRKHLQGRESGDVCGGALASYSEQLPMDKVLALEGRSEEA
jgi:hypothetical protein